MRFLACFIFAAVMAALAALLFLPREKLNVTDFRSHLSELVHTAADRGYDCAVQGLTREQCHQIIDARLEKPE